VSHTPTTTTTRTPVGGVGPSSVGLLHSYGIASPGCSKEVHCHHALPPSPPRFRSSLSLCRDRDGAIRYDRLDNLCPARLLCFEPNILSISPAISLFQGLGVVVNIRSHPSLTSHVSPGTWRITTPFEPLRDTSIDIERSLTYFSSPLTTHSSPFARHAP
jgi:hypothetical protein